MNIDRAQKFTPSSGVLFQEVNGEMVLLNLESEKYFGLDEIGARIWSLLQAGSSMGQVVDGLIEEYDVDPVTLRKDVADLIDSLVEERLLREAGD